MRGYMACGPLEQGPGCGPFGPYGRFGCQERRPGHVRFGPPGFSDGRSGCCYDDSGPESPRRHGHCQDDSGTEGPMRQGRRRRCSGRRGHGPESSDEEVRDRSCSRERRDGSPGRKCGCRRHHRGPFGHGPFGHGGPFGHSGPFGHRGPFGHLGPFGRRGPFGPFERLSERRGWGHGPSFGPFGEHFGRHGGQRGPFGPDDFDFGCGNCRCNQNEGCMRGGKGGCSKNKNQNKDGETEGARRKKNKQCGYQNKDQNETVLVQRIVVETPRSYSV